MLRGGAKSLSLLIMTLVLSKYVKIVLSFRLIHYFDLKYFLHIKLLYYFYKYLHLNLDSF